MSSLPQLPRSLPDPGKPPVPTKTLTRWDTFLGDIASGVKLEDAMLKSFMTRADIETCSRLDELQMQRWRDAKVAGRKRKWTVMQLEEIFGKIAEGATIEDAQIAVMGVADRQFHQLVISDPDLYAQYRRALEARALVVGESILGILDDDSGDTITNPSKFGDITVPNMAAVTRDKLRAEGRLRIMGMWNTKLYGEKKDAVQVNVQINHAERLEEARSRATLREKRVTPEQMKTAIDATFMPVPDKAPEGGSGAPPVMDSDTSWMDAAPTDTVWREEK
jgi:hypothetical protein